MNNGDAMNRADREMLPLLAGWLDGELSAEEQQRVEAALERSAALRGVLDEWRSVDTQLGQVNVERRDEEWEALATRIEAAIASDEPQGAVDPPSQVVAIPEQARRRRWFRSPQWAMGGSGALAAGIILVLLWPNPQKRLAEVGVLENNRSSVSEPLIDHPKTAPPDGAESRGPLLPSKSTPGTRGTAPVQGITDTKDPSTASAEPADPSPTLGNDETLLREEENRRKTPSVVSPQSAIDNVQGLPQLPATRETPVQLTAPDRTAESMSQGGSLANAPEPATTKEHEQDETKQATPPTVRIFNAYQGSSQARDRASRLDTAWLSQAHVDLDVAVENEDQADLAALLADVEERSLPSNNDAEKLELLGLAVRARAEYLRLFPNEVDNTELCRNIRRDYEAWESLADGRAAQPLEADRVRQIVREVCPE